MKQTTKIILLALAGSVLLLGCGKSSDAVDPGTIPGTVPGATATTPTVGTVATAVTNFVPNSSYSFTLTGNGSTTVPQSFVQNGQTVSIGIATDNVFKVRVRSGSAQTITAPNSNFSATYGCVSYDITVLGQTISTNVLSVDGANNLNCAGAADNQVIDFSSRLSSGHQQSLFVSVGNARYDFYCEMVEWGYIWSGYASMYCPLHTVYQNHRVSGTLDIQTNSLN